MIQEDFFSRLKQQYSQQLPFVVYNTSGSSETVKALVQGNSELFTTEDFTESGFVFAPFDDDRPAILIPENTSEKLLLEQVMLPEAEPVNGFMPDEFSEVDKQKHIKIVSKAVKALSAGEMDKVVLSRKEEVTLTEEDPLVLFLDLLKNYSTAFVYCWYHPKVGLWLGATPETLLQVEGNRFKTMALAGTQQYKGTINVDWGEKEKQEQQFVTDSILENLKRYSAEKIEISTPFTAKAGNLLHLRTDISGNLISRTDALQGVSSKKIKNIITALHPTPAVCGLPKEKAKQFILKEEDYHREFYTGFLGELNFQQVTQRSRSRRNVENLAYRAVKKETSLFVNLRCMKIEDGKAVLFIGGGITKDSVSEDEWQETVNKAGTMKKVLLK
jgi:isochorismate synthase